MIGIWSMCISLSCAAAPSKPMFRIDWREGAPYPHVLNGGMVGRVDDWVVYACGFGRRATGVEKVDGYTRHTMAYEIAKNRWIRLPDFPGTERAYGTASGLYADGWTYVLGGQSYSAPLVFKDGWRIGRSGDRLVRRDGDGSRQKRAWVWEKLPDLPFTTAEFGACIVGRKLYIQGGAFYGRVDGAREKAYWCSVTDEVGRKFAVLDLADVRRSWKMLPPLPGVGRNHHVMAAADGKLVVFGGIATVPREGGAAWQRDHYCVVDNWAFDPAAQTWKRLADLPRPLGGHASLTYKDRWVLLFGGYSDRKVLTTEGKIVAPFGSAKGFEDRVIVYDAKEDVFSEATPMLHAINDPRTAWIGEGVIFIATGEIPNSRRIPNCQIGRLIGAGQHPVSPSE